MRTSAKEKTSPVVSESGASDNTAKSGNVGSWFRTHWRLTSLFVIIAIAFILRFAFAYGISADDNYALSGGSSASSHLRIITEILAGTYDPSSQSSIGYPYGAESIYGPLFDYVMAFFAFIISACGVSDATAAAGTLAWSAPILGALTCIPVYLVAKKIFKDELVGIVSALFYAVFAISIMTTAFSNGTEYPFVCFLFAWTIYFLLRTFEAVEKTGATGIKSVFTVDSVRSNALITGVLLAFIILSWNDFWAIIIASAIIIFFTLLFERLGGREMGATVGISALILLVAVVIGAVYYVPAGLWDSIFSGGCLVAILTVVYSLIFLALEKKPWVLSIPVMVVIIAVVAAVFAVALPDLSSAMLGGNSYYEGTLMSDLADDFSRTSISQMASYFGWLTLWFPLFVGVWMLYKFRDNAKDKTYVFTMLWLFACFLVGWFNSNYAVVSAIGFAVGAGVLTVRVLQAVDVKSYFKSFRGIKGTGFRAGAKKVLNFFPFITVIAAVCLVAAPAAIYAVDAATPTNDEHADYFGGLGYTINTSDSTLVSAAWDNLDGKHDDSAIITWYGYSDAASSVGGFNSVTSATGNGVSAMASAYLSAGSSGAIATMIIRLVENDAGDYKAIFENHGVGDVVNYIDNTSEARKYMKENVSEFTGYNSSVAKESLPYIVGVQYLTSKLGESQLSALYDDLCIATGHNIGYVEIDSSMIPLYYGDGSYANTIGYFGDYSQDRYGAPAEFYTVTSTTEMYYQYGYYSQLYYTYNDAFYETFLWNALLGVSLDQYGYSSSTQLLSELSASDGTVKAVPATGMGNFAVEYWHVMYQADGSSEWVDMDAYEAIKEQNANGGLINYLASVVVLKYVSSASSMTVSGTVDCDGTGVENIKVAVFEKVSYDSSGNTGYVQRSTATTDKDGNFTVSVPAGNDYIVRYYVGSETLRDGTIVETKESSATSLDHTLHKVTQPGTLVVSDNVAFKNSGATIGFTASNGDVVTVTVDDNGDFTAAGLVPDVYTVTVYSSNGTSLNTITLTVVDAIPNLYVSAAAATINITVKDMFGNDSSVDTTVTLVGSDGTFEAERNSDGKYVANVIAGTYLVSVNNNDFVSVASTTVRASASEAQSATLTVYKAGSSLEAGTYTALGYITVSDGSMHLPDNLSAGMLAKAVDSGISVSGTLMNSSNKGVSGTIAFINDSDSKAYLFSSDSDGAFSATVPSGEYTVYATDASGQAYYGKASIAADATDVEYQMSRAYAVTETVSYNTNMSSPSSQGIAFVPLTFTVTVDAESYAIPAITGSAGTYVLYVPEGATVSCEAAASAFAKYDKFEVTEDFKATEVTDLSRATTLDTFRIVAKSTADATATVIPTYVSDGIHAKNHNGDDYSSDLVFQLDAYTGSSYDRYIKTTGSDIAIYSDSGCTTPVDYLMPGRYTVVYKGDDGLMFSDEVIYLYPGFKDVVFDVTESYAVEVTKESSDKVTVVAIDDGTYSNNSNTYYFETGHKFYFVVTDSDETKIAISKVFVGTDSYTYTLADKVVLSGYVGAKVSGNIVLTTADFELQVEVKDGEYSVDLPTGSIITSMKLKADYEGTEYVYSVEDHELLVSGLTVSEDTVKNFVITTESSLANASAEITGGTLANGIGDIKVTVTNDNDYDVTYIVTGSDAFVLAMTYNVSVPANNSNSVDVRGYYNELTLGAGNTSATVTVSDVNGTEVATVVIPAKYYSGDNEAPVITYADSENSTVYDAVDGYAYKYAIAIENKGATVLYLNSGSVTVDDGWLVAFVDSDGYLVDAKLDGSVDFELKGYSTTVVYVMLVNIDGDETATVPTVTVNASVVDSNDVTVATISAQALAAKAADVSEDDSSASGDDIDNSENGTPAAFWALVVLTILVLLLIVWGGMKRGVFTRRN